jgi:hypothetical protein
VEEKTGRRKRKNLKDKGGDTGKKSRWEKKEKKERRKGSEE